jgi:hypothetical protein
VVGETFGVTLHDWVAAFPTHFDDEYIVAPLRTLAKRVDQQNGAGPVPEWCPVTWLLKTSDEHYRNATRRHSVATTA